MCIYMCLFVLGPCILGQMLHRADARVWPRLVPFAWVYCGRAGRVLADGGRWTDGGGKRATGDAGRSGCAGLGRWWAGPQAGWRPGIAPWA